MAPIQLGKFNSYSNSLAIFNESLVVEGDFTYCCLRANHIASHVPLSNVDIVDLPIRNANDCDCWESPVARYLKVTINFSAAEIGFLDLHCFLAEWAN